MDKKHDITFAIEKITPQLAQYYLTKNTGNYRTLLSSRVDQYKSDIINGKWEFNGEPIQFSKSGKLLNGQHRLTAIWLSGKTVEMVVERGLDDDTLIFDIGKMRTTSDIAKHSGLPSAVTSNVSIGTAGLFASRTFRCLSKNIASKTEIIDTAYYLQDYLELSHKIICTKKTSAPARRCAVQAGVVVLLYLSIAPVDILYDFFEIVNTGFSKADHESSAAIVLRNYLLAPHKNPTETARRLYSMTIDAVMDYQNNRRRTRCYVDNESNINYFYQICDEIKEEINKDD